ncbi:hypothetical protein HID58_034288 [Brassica napus]|uniref:NAD(P)H dehydrogenase (quinone) n=1 Tax=Brassica napus TaxID=3708 RepID=A0ABQ8C1J8_BRANA|nr:hypothetical protein HID58_034288 [Brassica napus]
METGTVMKQSIRVAALSGSLRKGSYHKGLLRAAIDLAKESVPGMQIEYIDISPLPFMNTDLEINGTYPAVVEAFRQKILEADSILFASPEYNYSVSGISKRHIYIICLKMGFHWQAGIQFSLNAFQPPEKFDVEGNLVDESAKERLKKVLISLQEFTMRLQGRE